MTLYNVLADGGIVLSFCLLLVLAGLHPSRRDRRELCFKPRPDAECMPGCLRACSLLAARVSVMEAPAWAL